MRDDSESVQIDLVLEEMNDLLCDYARDPSRDGVNVLHLMMGLAGLMVEGCFLFDQPNDALDSLLDKLARRLKTNLSHADLPSEFLPAAYVIDDISELGRDIARHILKQNFDDPHSFAEAVLTLAQQHIVAIEGLGIPRDEAFRILYEFATRAMVLEVAAQELCDVLIERKIGDEEWSLGDCISSLSGLSGYKVAVWYQAMSGRAQARALAQGKTFGSIVEVMTREAVRYGIPGGTDWSFGLPANDLPANPPSLLISGVLPFCESFFRAVKAFDPIFQATACAKAAGRMLAVASGGEMPELSPAIAKPLAMCAMNESYRSLLS